MKTSWRSRPPVAMDRLIRQRLEETSHELHRLNSLWGLLAHPQAGVAESMERIEGVDAVNRRIQAFRARSTVQTLKTAPKAGRGVAEGGDDARMADRHRPCRVVVRVDPDEGHRAVKDDHAPR
ncbi:hypothetical protein GCM10010412_076730 [Nonomuraea recticatena]|uniref:Uncharacterized protein n=1 Tax=Nonomuraea recticatena TaxID=46178 RepID=A0ABN3T0M1_9ACTN